MIKELFCAYQKQVLKPLSAALSPAHQGRTWPCVCGGVAHHSPFEGESGDSTPTLAACENCKRLFLVVEFELRGQALSILIDEERDEDQ